MANKTVIKDDGTIESFTDWIKADGSTDFQPEKGRYHLYHQYMCPFSHRVLLARTLKGLEDVISCDNMDYVLEQATGWKFSGEKEGCDADSVNGYRYLKEAYEASAKQLGASGYSGAVTVPTLYDKKLKRVVTSESADILRMFNGEFNDFCATPAQKEVDLYPASLRAEIEDVTAWVEECIACGVYAPGFAENQTDYNACIEKLFGGLDRAEALLSKNRYLLGKQMTEADIKLFVVLIRFDLVFILMRCCKKRIADYPALWAYTRDIYQTGGVKGTISLDQIMKGHFSSYYTQPINPFGVVPALLEMNYDEPANRENM